jgi:hypothetical protein
MDQRRTAEWRKLDRRRVHLLIEDPQAAWFSQFETYRAAGFEVTVCSGPGGADDACPHLRGERCPLWEEADVVLCSLPDTEASRTIVERGQADHPATQVIVSPEGDDGTPTDATASRIRSLRWHLVAEAT